jgi:prepilin-type N-terminal cleavage/methylation domain-containing protein
MTLDDVVKRNAGRRLYSFVTLSAWDFWGGGGMLAKVSAKSSTAEHVVRAGTKLALDHDGGGVGVPSARRSQRGFTLIEWLVVIAILGLITLIAVININNAWQKARLKAEAGNLSAFLQSAYTFMVTNRAPVFVQLKPAGGGQPLMLRICQRFDCSVDVNGNGIFGAPYLLPSFATLDRGAINGSSVDANTVWPCNCTVPPTPCTITNSGPGSLELDTMGRAANPYCTNFFQVTASQTLFMTHVNMVTGALKPNIAYTLQVFPVWKVQKTP